MDLRVASGGAALGAGLDAATDGVHVNSANSMRGTELYYLIINDTGVIDKIGITSNPAGRFPQSYLRAENVTCVTLTQYVWRYTATVDENIRLTFYGIENGELPRINIKSPDRSGDDILGLS
jgi:hypothetical protein